MKLINLCAPLYFLLTARNANKLVKSMIMAGLKSIRVLLFKQKQDRYCFLRSLLTVNNLNVKMFSKISKPEIFLWNSTSYRIKTCYPNGAWFFFQFPSWTKRETKKQLNSKIDEITFQSSKRNVLFLAESGINVGLRLLMFGIFQVKIRK